MGIDEADDLDARRTLWLGHGHTGMYGDDGEMQCGECAQYGIYDYKHEPLAKVALAAFSALRAQLREARTNDIGPGVGPDGV